jgi:hypothetical protein
LNIWRLIVTGLMAIIAVPALAQSGTAIAYSTYLGTTVNEFISNVAVDGSGNAYVVVSNVREGFPLVPVAPFDWPFLFKFAPDGTVLYAFKIPIPAAQCTVTAVALDSSRNAYLVGSCLTGITTSWPTTPGVFDAVRGTAFIGKVNSSGTALVYFTRFGGSGTVLASDTINDVMVDNRGFVYVTGQTVSNDFPALNATQGVRKGGEDAFVAVLNDTASALVFSTHWGGTSDDSGNAIRFDSAGNVWIAGVTGSTDFPLLAPWRTVPGSGFAFGFVSEFDSTGKPLYSTYTGVVSTSTGAVVPTLAIAPSGTLVISQLSDLLKLAPDGTTFGTFLTAPGPIKSVSFDGQNEIYVGGGYAARDTLPSPSTLLHPFQTFCGVATVYSPSYQCGFVAKFDAAGLLLYSSFASDWPGYISSVAPAPNGDLLAAGHVGNYPVVRAAQPNFGGGTTNGMELIFPSDPLLMRVIRSDSPVLGSPATTIDFGAEAFGSSRYASLGIAALSSANVHLQNVATTGDFSSIVACGNIVPAAQKCNVTITFAPTTGGVRTGQLTITSDAGNSPLVVDLTGSGLIPAMQLSPSSLQFSPQALNSASPAQAIQVKNTGTSGASIQRIDTTGDFTQTNNCGTALYPQQICTISVTFVPTAAGVRSGTVSVTDDTPGSPQIASLSGFGGGTGPSANLSTTALDFAGQLMGGTSAAQTVTLSNNGGGPLAISSISASAEFGVSQSCGSSLAVGASCPLTVTFTPTATGPRTGTLAITTNASGSPHNVSLSGTGTSVALQVGASQPSSITISAGQSASFTLSIGGAGYSGVANLSCTGTPASTTCSLPATVSVSATAASSFVVRLDTTARASAHPSFQVLAVTMLLFLGFGASFDSKRKKIGLLLAILTAATLMFLISCGGGSTSTPVVPPPSGTPSGTYTVTVTATVQGVASSTRVTVVVN